MNTYVYSAMRPTKDPEEPKLKIILLGLSYTSFAGNNLYGTAELRNECEFHSVFNRTETRDENGYVQL